MKTDIVGALEEKGRAGEKWIEPKSQLTMVLLVSVALAVTGCESDGGKPAAKPSSTDIGQPTYAGELASAASLSGRWFQEGKATSISVGPDGQHLTITNAYGKKLSGYMDSNHEIVIYSLGIRGVMRGHISHGGRRISWSYGVEWTR